MSLVGCELGLSGVGCLSFFRGSVMCDFRLAYCSVWAFGVWSLRNLWVGVWL